MKTLILKTTLLLIAISTSISVTAATYKLKVITTFDDEVTTYEKRGITKQQSIQLDAPGDDHLGFNLYQEHNETVYFEYSINVSREKVNDSPSHPSLAAIPIKVNNKHSGTSAAPLGETTEIFGGKRGTMQVLITREEEIEAE